MNNINDLPRAARRAWGYLCRVGAFCRGSCDNWNFNASNPCVYAGGNYNQNSNHGLFYFNYNSASNTNDNIGSRCLAKKFG